MEPIFSLKYFLDSKEVEKAIVEWHFGVSRVKNTIYTVVLSILAVNFLLSAILHKDTLSIFIVAACIFGILMVLLLPSFQVKPLARAYGDGFNFTLNIYEDKIEVVSESGNSELDYEGIIGILESKNYYCFEFKGRFYPVPKSAVDEDKKPEIRRFLQEKVEKRYKNLNKK